MAKARAAAKATITIITTIIMATHDLEEIKTMDVRVICLATTLKFDGKISDWKGL